jgi:hypothetical protein
VVGLFTGPTLTSASLAFLHNEAEQNKPRWQQNVRNGPFLAKQLNAPQSPSTHPSDRLCAGLAGRRYQGVLEHLPAAQNGSLSGDCEKNHHLIVCGKVFTILDGYQRAEGKIF